MNTKTRLAALRKKAVKFNSKPYLKNFTWREVRWCKLYTKHYSPSVGEEGEWYTENKEDIGVFLGEAHELARLDSMGYYRDHHQDECVRAGVAKLHTSRGTLYIPVTWEDGSDGSTHWMADAVMVPKTEHNHTSEIRDIARMAARHAELLAGESREYYAKDQAEQDIAELKFEIKDLHSKAKAVIAAIREQGALVPTICQILIENLRDLREETSEKWRRITRLEDNFWEAA